MKRRPQVDGWYSVRNKYCKERELTMYFDPNIGRWEFPFTAFNFELATFVDNYEWAELENYEY